MLGLGLGGFSVIKCFYRGLRKLTSKSVKAAFSSGRGKTEENILKISEMSEVTSGSCYKFSEMPAFDSEGKVVREGGLWRWSQLTYSQCNKEDSWIERQECHGQSYRKLEVHSRLQGVIKTGEEQKLQFLYWLFWLHNIVFFCPVLALKYLYKDTFLFGNILPTVWLNNSMWFEWLRIGSLLTLWMMKWKKKKR